MSKSFRVFINSSDGSGTTSNFRVPLSELPNINTGDRVRVHVDNVYITGATNISTGVYIRSNSFTQMNSFNSGNTNNNILCFVPNLLLTERADQAAGAGDLTAATVLYYKASSQLNYVESHVPNDIHILLTNLDGTAITAANIPNAWGLSLIFEFVKYSDPVRSNESRPLPTVLDFERISPLIITQQTPEPIVISPTIVVESVKMSSDFDDDKTTSAFGDSEEFEYEYSDE